MKKIKGFTLIECIIAMAVLGIASTIMAGIYANVARINRQNALVNTSLSNQMAHVEKYEDAETVKVDYTTAGGASTKTNAAAPHTVDSGNASKPYVEITKLDSSGNKTSIKYSYPVDVYSLLSRDNNDKDMNDSDFGAQYKDKLVNSTSVGGPTEENFNLRYRYVLGHPLDP